MALARTWQVVEVGANYGTKLRWPILQEINAGKPVANKLMEEASRLYMGIAKVYLPQFFASAAFRELLEVR